ncbi:MAG: hypothetical protein H6605_10660 [Flavobacteriales bacterium]|nr:hypothetical protein [Flavobacteriales bacterium]
MLFALIILFFLSFIIGEILVRKFVEAPKEHYYKFDNKYKLYKRKPGLEGHFLKRNVKGYFKLNNAGWNSMRDYYKEKTPGVTRIACIGSSETGCYEVHVKEAWPHQLELNLNKKGANCEVYTFAADRAIGIAHALHLTRYVIAEYAPDIIIYNSSFNEETLYGATDKRHYMLLDVKSKDKIREIPPVNDRTPVLGEFSIKNLIFQSRLIKYLRPKLAIRTRLYKLMNFFKGKDVVKNNPDSKALNKNELGFAEKMDIAIDYCLEQFHLLSQKHGVKMIFGLRTYKGKGFNWSNNALVDNAKQERLTEYKISKITPYGFPYFDTTEAYEKDYEINGKKFDFLLDPHLNKYGCDVEARAIGDFMIEKNLIEINQKQEL